MANNVGSALSSLLTTGVTFAAPLDTTIVPQTGTGSATYTRATVATVFDKESVLRNVLSGEARFQGARRVANLHTSPEDFSAAAWTKTGSTLTSGFTAPDGTATAWRLVGVGASSWATTQSLTIPDGTFIESIWVKSNTGVSQTFRLNMAAGGTGDITATTSWQRFSSGTATGVAGARTFGIRRNGAAEDADLLIWHPQSENVTGQSNQAPSEYVSVGVLSTPFHGAGVDGVKYFSTTNGNSVASNVVTEASGSPISASTLLGYLAEGAGTQLVTPTASIRDMTNAAWVKGATMTAALTGTGIDGVANSCSRLTGGAVAGTNTAFQTLVAAATSRTYSCYIKRVTGTGTINITQNGGTGYTDITSQINSSTFTRVSLNASVLNAAFGIQIVTSGDVILVDFNQFESGAFATSPMASAGAARNADVLTYPSAGNISGTVGSAYCEVTGSDTNGQNDLITCLPSAYPVYYNSNVNTLLLYDGALGRSLGSFTISNSIQKAATNWGGVTCNGATGGVIGGTSPAVFDGDLNIGANINIAGGTVNQHYGTIRNVRIYSAQLSAAQLSAVTA